MLHSVIREYLLNLWFAWPNWAFNHIYPSVRSLKFRNLKELESMNYLIKWGLSLQKIIH